MKLSDIYSVSDEFAPKAYSDEYCERYGAYDNSGILIDSGKEIGTVLFSLDFSLAAVKKAKEIGAELMITHHPAIYGKIGSVRLDDSLGRKLIECIENGISVISMHLNLDVASGGIDESLQTAICRACGKESGTNVKFMHEVAGGGYGRVYDLPKTVFSGEFGSRLKEELKAAHLFVFGENKKISRAASFCGAGASEESIAFALQEGADVIVSSDFKHHLLAAATEAGAAVVVPTHYAAENYGFKKYYQKISRKLPSLTCVYHEDECML